jgi:uncharacterized protein
VQVTVTEVDMQRNRIALSMKQQPEIGGKKERSGTPGGAQRGRGGNDFGNNWFDSALKK